MDKNFLEAKSDNLPRIDAFCMFSYMRNNPDFMDSEMKGVKIQTSTRESYGDKAVGFVQLRREGTICIVKGRVTPEHRVTKKPYSVTLVCDEVEQKVISVQCEDCPASLGGCKHAVAFLAWVHRRSEEPSPTSVECYWKKAVLSTVGSSLKFVKVSTMPNKKRPYSDVSSDDFLEKVIDGGRKKKRTNTMIGKYFREESGVEKLSMYKLIKKFLKTGNMAPNDFIEFCKGEFSEAICSKAEEETRNQSKSALWHELRYGRITASKAYEASKCKTMDGSLVERIFGASGMKETKAMRRGIDLEVKVRKVVNKKCQLKFKPCGVMLSKEDPILGASADGIDSDFVLEIKCPSSSKTISNYVKNEVLTPKCVAQIQLQMLMYGKKHGIFCVAHPDFEVSSEVTTVKVDRDDNFIMELISDCNKFWTKAIFPALVI